MIEALPPGAFGSAVTGIHANMAHEACKGWFCGARSPGESGLDVPGNVDQDDALAAVQENQRLQ